MIEGENVEVLIWIFEKDFNLLDKFDDYIKIEINK